MYFKKTNKKKMESQINTHLYPSRAVCTSGPHLCGNFELLDHSELEEHANAGFDEVKLRDGEVAEGERVQVLSTDVVSWRAGSFLNRNMPRFKEKTYVNH